MIEIYGSFTSALLHEEKTEALINMLLGQVDNTGDAETVFKSTLAKTIKRLVDAQDKYFEKYKVDQLLQQCFTEACPQTMEYAVLLNQIDFVKQNLPKEGSAGHNELLHYLSQYGTDEMQVAITEQYKLELPTIKLNKFEMDANKIIKDAEISLQKLQSSMEADKYSVGWPMNKLMRCVEQFNALKENAGTTDLKIQNDALDEILNKATTQLYQIVTLGTTQCLSILAETKKSTSISELKLYHEHLSPKIQVLNEILLAAKKLPSKIDPADAIGKVTAVECLQRNHIEGKINLIEKTTSALVEKYAAQIIAEYKKPFKPAKYSSEKVIDSLAAKLADKNHAEFAQLAHHERDMLGDRIKARVGLMAQEQGIELSDGRKSKLSCLASEDNSAQFQLKP